MVTCDRLETILNATIFALVRLDQGMLSKIEQACFELQGMHHSDADTSAEIFSHEPTSLAGALPLSERLSTKLLLLRRMLLQTETGLNLLNRGGGESVARARFYSAPPERTGTQWQL